MFVIYNYKFDKPARLLEIFCNTSFRDWSQLQSACDISRNDIKRTVQWRIMNCRDTRRTNHPFNRCHQISQRNMYICFNIVSTHSLRNVIPFQETPSHWYVKWQIWTFPVEFQDGRQKSPWNVIGGGDRQRNSLDFRT